MDRNHNRITHLLLTSCMVGALMATALPSHAKAAESAPCVIDQHTLDARLAARADQSFTSLRNFVVRTRTIYELNVPEALDRVERYRQVCGK
jgi:hypothetical protein